MSPVRKPLFKVSITAASILFAALSSPKPYLKSIAALSTVANGFALSWKLVEYVKNQKTCNSSRRKCDKSTNLSSNIRSRTMYRFKKSRSLNQKNNSKLVCLQSVFHANLNKLNEIKYICRTDSPRLADGSIPILPVIIEASSDRISPKMLFVTIVSNCNYFVTNL